METPVDIKISSLVKAKTRQRDAKNEQKNIIMYHVAWEVGKGRWEEGMVGCTAPLTPLHLLTISAIVQNTYYTIKKGNNYILFIDSRIIYSSI